MKTKRLTLRPLELHDFQNWVQAYSIMSNPLNEWDETNWNSKELTLRKFKEHLSKHKKLQKKDQFYEFGIFRNYDGIFIGTINLMDVSRNTFQNAYLGYRIFNNYWGQGYASEAGLAILKIAFKKLKLHRVEAGIAIANKKSHRVAKSIGFRKEGLSRKRLYVNKKWIDLVLYATTRGEINL